VRICSGGLGFVVFADTKKPLCMIELIEDQEEKEKRKGF
jgi:hypothetical protein